MVTLVLTGGFVPGTGVASATEDTSLATESGTQAFDPLSCLERAGSDPLAAPFCLKGMGEVELSEASSVEEPAGTTCNLPAYSDKCPTWAGTYDHGYNEQFTAQALSPVGNRVYVSSVDWRGSTYSGGGGGGGASVVAIDQETGQQLWALPYDDPAGDRAVPSAMAVSPDGSRLYVTGMSSGGLETGWDFVTMAYDTSDGGRLWSSRYTGLGGEDGATSIALSPDGMALYVTGGSSGPDKNDYATVAYTALSGQQLWTARYATAGNDQPMSVGVDPVNSRLFVTGYSSSAPGSSAYDYATVVYETATGAQLWARRYGTALGSHLPLSLGVAPDGSRVFVTGSSLAGAGGSEFATLAYDAATGNTAWQSRYSHPSSVSKRSYASALGVGVDGQRVYVTGSSYKDGLSSRLSNSDYATVAYDAATGAQAWDRTYDHVANDTARAIAVSPDGERVYVTGSSDRHGDNVTSRADTATIAYDTVTGDQAWVGRYHQLPLPNVSTDDGLAVGVSGDSQRVVVGAQLSRGLQMDHGMLAYDAYDAGPIAAATPPPPVPDTSVGTAEGNFSLMAMAHSLPSASAGLPAQWDGKGEGTFSYNSNSCGEAAVVNNISTNLTSYNTLIPGTASPASTRSHPFQFAAGPPDAEGKSALSGDITVVACNMGEAGLPDAERPRIFIHFEATADKPATQEARFEGTFTISGGTGIYEDLTGQGQINGYLFCFAPGEVTAGACVEGAPLTDVHYTMTGWFHDPTVLGLREVSLPPPTPVEMAPPAPGGPGVVEGPFSLMHMVHSGLWDGSRPSPTGGSYQYSSIACSGRAPVNNVSTNLTTYNSRLPGSASPASTRNHPFTFDVFAGDHPRQRKIEATIALTVCKRNGGPTVDEKTDPQRERIDFRVSATTERVSPREVRFEGTFDIVGGTGVYQDLTGSGRIHGYLFCFLPGNMLPGDCSGTNYADGQYTMNGWYKDPTVAEVGVAPTDVVLGQSSPPG